MLSLKESRTGECIVGGLPGWRWYEPDQKLRLHFEPGSQFSYSGEGMTLLQVVIEKTTGKTLEQLMQEHIFGPLGMTLSSYTWQSRFETDYAVGHMTDGKVYEKDKDNAARSASTLETTTGWGAFKEGHGDGFQHYSIVYPAKKLGVLLMSNSDNAESIFGHLLTLTIADTSTPLEWESYVPYDRASPATR